MAQPTNGTVNFDLNGKAFTLRFSVNALIRAEHKLDMAISEIAGIFANAKAVRLGVLRDLFHAALTDRHPDITVDAAGEMMTDLTIPRSVELVTITLGAAFPAPTADASPGN